MRAWLLSPIFLFSVVLASCAQAALRDGPPGAPSAAGEIASVREVTTRDVVFENGGVALAATIVEPVSQGAVAGVVMLPGSGPATREMLEPTARMLATRGIAAIIFDKRGSGESAGDWTRSSLDDLAMDAIAAAAVLASQTALAESRIGFWGHSQGVWVASRAQELGATPAFVAAFSGGGASPRAVERHAYASRLAHAGVDPDGSDRPMAVVESYFDYLEGSLSRDEFDRRLAASPHAELFDFPIPSEAGRGAWSWVATFDPRMSTRESAAPHYVVLGGADSTIPLAETIEGWRESLSGARRGGDVIMILPGLGHHLERAAGGGGHGGGHGLSLDPSIWDGLAAWITARLDLPDPHAD